MAARNQSELQQLARTSNKRAHLDVDDTKGYDKESLDVPA